MLIFCKLLPSKRLLSTKLVFNSSKYVKVPVFQLSNSLKLISQKNVAEKVINFYIVSHFYNVLFQGVFAMVTLGSLAIVGLAAKEVNKFGDKLLEMERSLDSKASDDVLNVVSSFLSNQIGKVVSRKKKKLIKKLIRQFFFVR